MVISDCAIASHPRPTGPGPLQARPGFLIAVLLGIAAGFSPVTGPAFAQSALLESVKQNPARAKALCTQLRGFNAEGLSATSPEAVARISRQENLSPMDAEVLTTYVIGLHCPDVR